jgi:GNAT superfamily N-acetyltransferase
MSDAWMPTIELRMTVAEFRRLPRNAAYRYEYLEGKAYLSPRPKHYHALLDLSELPAPTADVDIRLLPEEEILELVPLFAGAFAHIQPYGSLEGTMREEAARQALERARTGGDGPWVRPASFVARQGSDAIGAILITLLPDTDPCSWDSYRWPEPPPSDCVERGLGRPHLTWVFVSPWEAGRGVGTALLATAGHALSRLGYRELLSTFMVGNDSSMLWHWRNGFRLLTHPGSLRRLDRQRLSEQ